MPLLRSPITGLLTKVYQDSSAIHNEGSSCQGRRLRQQGFVLEEIKPLDHQSSMKLAENAIQSRKRRALDALDHVAENKKRLLNAYYLQRDSTLKKEQQSLKQRIREDFLSALRKRKQEMNKIVDITYKFVEVRRGEKGKGLIVKLNKKYECQDHEKLMKLMNQNITPPEPPSPPPPRPPRRRKQQSKYERETRVEDVEFTVQWGLTADEIREDLQMLFPHRKLGRIVETVGFLNAPPKKSQRVKRKQFRR